MKKSRVPSFWHLTYYWMGHIFLLNFIFSVACVAGVKSGRVRENSSAWGGGGKRNAPCWHSSPSPTSIPPPLPILTSPTQATSPSLFLQLHIFADKWCTPNLSFYSVYFPLIIVIFCCCCSNMLAGNSLYTFGILCVFILSSPHV